MRNLTFSFTLLLILFVSSCQKGVLTENVQMRKLKYGLDPHPLPPPDITCEILGDGQQNLVGHVTYAHDAENIYVEYFTENGWTLTEVDLIIGTVHDLHIPTYRMMPMPPNMKTGLQGLTHYLITNPISQNWPNPVAVSAHCIVANGDRKESIWTKCTNSILYEEDLGNSPNRWCWISYYNF